MSKNFDHEYLKERTLHIKGIPQADRGGSMLMNEIEKVLAECGGQIKGMLIVPDMTKLLKISR